MGFHPCLVAQGIDGHGAGGAEIVAQAKGVAHFVAADEAHQLAHEFGVVLHFLSGFVEVAGLYHVPIVNQGHDVVIPADVALQNLAGARVVDLRAIGIGDVAGEVADDAVAGILHRHGAVIGPLLTADSILETGLLKGLLPVVHTLNEVGPPLLGRSGVYIIDDGLLGLYEVPPPHGVDGCRILGLQTPAGNEVARLHALLVVGVVGEVVGEIAHAGSNRRR